MNSTHNPVADIKAFQEGILKNVQPNAAQFLAHDRMLHNIFCLNEEVQECTEAYVGGDLVGVADAIADLIYFAYGFAWQMGVPMDKVWDAVHEANMTKVRGRTHRNVDGDAAKPDGWRDPKEVIKEILA